MPSDPSAASAALARLTDVLARAAGGVRPTPLELAEPLWLARQMERAAAEDPQPTPEPTSTTDALEERADVPEPAPPRPMSEHPATESESPRAPLHLPATGAPPGPYASLLSPLLQAAQLR
ncbi:hypothetical protein [Streptomyces sp. NPDC054834]